MNHQINQLARVIHEERISEYTLRRIDHREGAFTLLFRAVKNAFAARAQAQSNGRHAVAATKVSPSKLASR